MLHSILYHRSGLSVVVGSSSPHHSWGCTSRWFTVGQRHPPQLNLVISIDNLIVLNSALSDQEDVKPEEEGNELLPSMNDDKDEADGEMYDEAKSPDLPYCDVCKDNYKEANLVAHKLTWLHLIVSGDFFTFNPYLQIGHATRSTLLMCVFCKFVMPKHRFKSHEHSKNHKEKKAAWLALGRTLPEQTFYIYKESTDPSNILNGVTTFVPDSDS